MYHKVDKQPVILFDGFCNLCSSMVNFVIRHDRQKHFRYSLLSSSFSKEKLKGERISNVNSDTFVLVEEGQLYFKSHAAIKILSEMDFPYNLFQFFKIFPSNILDRVYDLIAANRYKWFGKKDKCLFPTDEIKDLFYS